MLLVHLVVHWIHGRYMTRLSNWGLQKLLGEERQLGFDSLVRAVGTWLPLIDKRVLVDMKIKPH